MNSLLYFSRCGRQFFLSTYRLAGTCLAVMPCIDGCVERESSKCKLCWLKIGQLGIDTTVKQ